MCALGSIVHGVHDGVWDIYCERVRAKRRLAQHPEGEQPSTSWLPSWSPIRSITEADIEYHRERKRHMDEIVAELERYEEEKKNAISNDS